MLLTNLILTSDLTNCFKEEKEKKANMVGWHLFQKSVLHIGLGEALEKTVASQMTLGGVVTSVFPSQNMRTLIPASAGCVSGKRRCMREHFGTHA